MATAAVFTVIPFAAGTGRNKGGLRPDRQRATSYKDKPTALRRAERLSQSAPGVLVVEAMVDEESGHADEPVLLASYGEAPSSLDDL